MRPAGYTLIELLITISIMAILGTVAFFNFKNFAQDQVLKKAIGQVQTSFREAQSDASSGVLCQNQRGADWQVQLNGDGKTIQISCVINERLFPIKTVSLENATFLADSISSSQCSGTSNPPLVVTYTYLSGKVNLIAGSVPCISRSSTITLTLTNDKNRNTKSFTISSGGAIDAK